jgi:hypothetical protein
MILPPLVHTPFRYCHRAEARPVPSLPFSPAQLARRFPSRVLWVVLSVTIIFAALFSE